MSDDSEVLLMKIEQQVSRICRALEHRSNDSSNEHFSGYLDCHFPSWKDNLTAQEWFDRNIGGHDVLNVGVDCMVNSGAVEITSVPIEAARNIFISGWVNAMRAMRKKAQS